MYFSPIPFLGNKVGTIVSYHPPIFKSMKRLTTEDVKQNIVLQAIARGVGIYSPHTACDNCLGGGKFQCLYSQYALQLLIS